MIDKQPLQVLLDQRPAIVSRWGLDRMEALLEELGHPERAFETFHVAGTNGKGSTAGFAAQILSAMGRRTGLYTSPHLSDVRERFHVLGQRIEEDALQGSAQRIVKCSTAGSATYFEVTTALSFLYFAEMGVEVAVMEAGLGGRLDATNVLEPIGTAITSIGLDHTELLGSNLESIAGEKAGILKPGVPVSLGPLEPSARKVLLDSAFVLDVPVAEVGLDCRTDALVIDHGNTRFHYTSARWPDGVKLKSPLLGRHQVINTALAVLMLEQSIPDLISEQIVEGVESMSLPGRFEVFGADSCTWVFDIAHNPQAIESLLETLRETDLPRPRVVVASILGDKEWMVMLERLAHDMDAIILTQPPSAPDSRRWDIEKARDCLLHRSNMDVRIIESLDEALDLGRELCGHGTVVVTGSTYTVGDARTLMQAA
jgi:dihydrofolate synthase/folylpolyglutamate synthase